MPTALSLGRDLAEISRFRRPVTRWRELRPMPRLRACRADWAAVNYKLARAGVLGQCHRAGIKTMIWTVDEDQEMRRWLADPRVTVLITSRPADAASMRGNTLLDRRIQNRYCSGMGRTGPAAEATLTVKGRQTRQRIVTAAAELMFEGGVAGTTMEDVRAAAGVSSSQIYHYFTDKEALVRAVIEYQNETIVGGQEPMLARLDTLVGLRAWRDFLVAHQQKLGCRGGCPIGSLGSELAETDPRARAAVAAGFGRWEAGIRRGYQAMHDREELAADPGQLATATLAALQGGLLLAQIRRSTEPLEAALDTVLAHVGSLIVSPAT